MSVSPVSTFDAYNISELRELARKRLPKGVFEFIDRGAEDEVALKNNRAAFERLTLVPRVLNDVSVIDQKIELFGRSLPTPMVIGPTGAAALLWYHGDLELARAAAATGIPFTIASATTLPIESILEVGGRQWFQLYPYENRALSNALVQKAYDLGCEALVVTADTATPPNREYVVHNGFAIPLRLSRKNVVDVLTHPRWLRSVFLRYLFTGGLPRYANLPQELQAKVTENPRFGAGFKCDNLDWNEIRSLRKSWRGIFMIKGIVSPQDAVLAVREGVDAIVVSNHGGRNLDGVIATMDALPAVLDAVEGRVPVLLDSGIRRGSDIVKALALGAKAVLLGRAPLYGLAIAGQAGVQRSLDLLREETGRVMAFCGCRTIAEIARELVSRP
jgi:(S)-mandelate dehydrogenase